MQTNLSRLKRFLLDVVVVLVVGAVALAFGVWGLPQVAGLMVLGLVIYLLVTGYGSYRELWGGKRRDNTRE